MTDRLVGAFDLLLSRMAEPPTWEEVSTIEASAVVAHRRQGPAWAVAAGVVTVLVIGIAAVFLSTGEPAATTVPAFGVECEEPPLAERGPASPVQVSVDPNPVVAGAIVTLSVSRGDLSSRYGAGTAAFWQCWDGANWVDTHIAFIIGREGHPETIQSLPGVTVTFAASAFGLPFASQIVIPEVPPGTYRLRIGLTASASEELDVFGIVEVAEGKASTTTTAPTTTVEMEPEVTTPDVPGATVVWQLDDVGMDAVFIASSGRVVLANEDTVFVANGFSSDARQTVTAASAENGEIVWQRDDIVSDDVFLQAVAGDLLFVNGQFDTLAAVDTATGATIWTFDLPDRYGVVSSAIDGDQIIVAAEAAMEGDTRPPLVYALDLIDGAERWSTSLTEGTDLRWSSPPVADGLVLIAATPSHPGVGSNMLHALDISSGEIRWSVKFGGDQGFHTYPVLVDGDVVILWLPEDVLIAVDLQTGAERWRLPGFQPLLTSSDGFILATGAAGLQRVEIDTVTIDNVTATVMNDALTAFPIVSASSAGDQIILAGRLGLRGLDTETAELLWHWSDSPLVDGRVAVAKGLVFAPTSDGGVVAVRIPNR